ncbi:TlpA disulfide reductase family protein [Flavivirga aquimarina]|uniref:TlpA disulfide reductase family protein n=1 Tax=Flavivirga aquimarina TaxID=2027862 RepID=A0ABT8W5Q0_9FLAO|nr:TlpA disulfide reductase family protein [Flavivirga aquimarina]MDO5968394.1 TlpA disulfide reductase family protein [Flavivirga aquimarina]
MKKQLLILLVVIFSQSVIAQKIIENPEYGLSSFPGVITKIELVDTTTVLHFHIKKRSGRRITIPRKSYIEEVDSGNKLFMTKAVGVEIGSNTLPVSGELVYALHFPKLRASVKTIDFRGGINDSHWAVYDIIVNEESDAFVLPKILRGNWMLIDGSNRWDYGFYNKNAIINRGVWNYKSVKVKGEKYTITLERNGNLKTVYAKLNKNGQVNFGIEPKLLKTYSLEKVYNPNYKLENDTPYEAASLFQLDSATYAGVVKGYTNRAKGVKDIPIIMQDCFTLKRDHYKVRIADDGSFSIKLPVSYPQNIIVVLPYGNEKVYVEPGKETFHLVDGNNTLFMGDCAMLNSGLRDMESIDSFGNREIMMELVEMSVGNPDDYKKACFELRDKENNALKELNKKQFFSRKALQIKKIGIEFSMITTVLAYERYRKYMKAKMDKDKIGIKDFKVEASFYNFISKEVLDNRLMVLEPLQFTSFTRNLTSAYAFRNKAENYTEDNPKALFGKSDSVIENNIKEFFGMTEGFAFDYIRLHRATKIFTDSLKIYTNLEVKNIQQEIKDPFLSKYIEVVNNKAKEIAEANKLKKGYHINVVKKAKDEDLVDAMLKKFKGKVVYIDFWATWCGACIPAINRIRPLKEEMKNEDVVFLYITNQTTPEVQWKKLIVDIKGEHYRVSKDEWNYLEQKFNIRGIPHYALVNKQGEIVNPKMEHNSNATLKAIFKTEMQK